MVADPFIPGCRPLEGHEDHYRIRVSRYRLIIEVFEDVVEVSIVMVGNRDDIYRDF